MDPQIHSQLLDKIRSYTIPQSAISLLSQNPPLIIAGVTASGKDAVLRQITETSNYRQVVTHTTRPSRPGEQNAQHYHFVSEEQMLELANNIQFVEMQNIHGGTIYGTSIQAYQDVVQAGHKPLIRIDVQGIEQLSRHIHGLRAYFLLPPSFEIWQERLEKRGHMSHTEKIRRFRSAKDELERVLRHPGFILIVNQDVPATATEILRGATDMVSQHKRRELAQQLLDHIRAY